MILEVKGAPFGARHVDMTWHDMTWRGAKMKMRKRRRRSQWGERRKRDWQWLTSNPRTLAYSRGNQLRGRIDSGRFSSVKIRTWTCMRESIYTCMNTRGNAVAVSTRFYNQCVFTFFTKGFPILPMVNENLALMLLWVPMPQPKSQLNM